MFGPLSENGDAARSKRNGLGGEGSTHHAAPSALLAPAYSLICNGRLRRFGFRQVGTVEVVAKSDTDVYRHVVFKD
jgi:hypothetical protein